MGIPVESKIHCPYCSSDDIFFNGSRCICGECGKKFQLPDEEDHFKPMELFLSYGHPEAEICKQIKQALEDRGHKVWFDEEQITHGADWRERIAQGIKRSNGVIACLSRHSVRDPGVCLDELSIAIGVRGGNIKTILLEPEQDTDPPASVCHIQWLDMSSWRTYYEQGGTTFRPWFEQKMSQLFEIIENDESRGFVGQISGIRDKLYINYSTSKQSDLLKQLFVGREWLTEQLEQWLDDPAGTRLCLLCGDPGVGKSAFAARYVHYNPRVAASLFCENGNPHYNDTRTVIMTLTYLLACRLPSYRVVLAGILDQEKRLGELGVPELFDRLLATPLSSLSVDGGHETLCIVIDGLDECGNDERNALAETLARYVPRLPKWLRVLATAREVSAVMNPLQDAYHLELHGTQEQNLEDIRFYFEECLQEKHGQEPGWQDALTELAERSGGIFLYARLVTEGILSGNISIDDPSQFPDGLSSAFYRWFGWFFPDVREYREHFRLPLGMLLAAPEPLPTEELKRIFDWDDNELEDFLRRMEVLVRRDINVFHKETVVFSHQYIAQWLDSRDAGDFQSHRSAALERMAKRFYAFFQQDTEGLTEFEALHLSELLEMSGDDSAWNEAMMSRDLLARIVHFGDSCKIWGVLPEAMRYFQQAQTMTEHMADYRNEPDDQQNLSASYDRIANILQEQGNLDGAMELQEKALEIQELLVQERGTPEDRYNLSLSYDSIADILQSQGELDDAMDFIQKAFEISDLLVQERGMPEDCQVLTTIYIRFADILQAQGDLDGAMDLYQNALELSELLVQERGIPDDRLNLFASYDCVANILQAQGDLDGAMDLYQKALGISQLLAQERGAPVDRQNLSVSYQRIAKILQAQGELDSALDLHQKALEISQLLAQERGIPDDRHNLLTSYNCIANILQAQGELDGAMDLYQRALEISELLVQERGTPVDRLNLSVGYEHVANILQAQGELDGAMDFYQKVLEIREQLAQERGILDDHQNLSASYESIAIILQEQGELDDAMALHEKALEIREQLAQERGMLDDHQNLSASYENIAIILQAQGELDDAMDLYQKVLELRELLVQERGTQEDRQILFASYVSAADILHAQGELNGAMDLYEKALAISEQLVQERGTQDDLQNLSVSYVNIADILQAQGESDSAMDLHQKALEVSELLVQERGTQNDLQNLSVSYERIADILQAQGELDSAMDLHQKALEIREPLVQERGMPDDLQNLFVSYDRIADILQAQGELDSAMAYREKALAIQDQLS